MIIENLFPVLTWVSPPTSDKQASERVSEASGSILESPLTKLVGSVFSDADQLERAFCECKLRSQKSFLMKSGPNKTMKFCIENIQSGTVWHLIATQYPTFLIVHNVKLIVAPNEKPDAVTAFKKCLDGEEEESE